MNPLQTLAVLLCCTAVIAIKMSLLMAQGISLLMALLVVYLVAVFFMLGLQHRARQSCESATWSDSEPAVTVPARSNAATRLTLV